MDSKTMAWVSYLTIIGWIIAIVNYGNNKSELAAFHIRQSLGLFVTAVGFMIVSMIMIFIPFLGWMISMLLSIGQLGILAGVIYGIITAAAGDQKLIPVVGPIYQKIFKFVA